MPRLLLLVALAVAGLASALPALAEGQILSVDIDHARVLKVPRPAGTVIIGNPAIADVSVQDANTMVLTGKSYGMTNLIILDSDGNPMVDESVGVGSSEQGTVRVYRQAERQTFSCSPICEPTVTIGDAETPFSETASQFSLRQSLATSALK